LHAKALLHGTQQSTSADGSLTVLHRPIIQMLGRNWEVFLDQVPTAQNNKQKL